MGDTGGGGVGAVGVEIEGIWDHWGPLRWRLGAFGSIGVEIGGRMGPWGVTEVEIGGIGSH